MKGKYLAVTSATIIFLLSASVAQALSKRVIGNLVYWDQARGFQYIQTNVATFSEVSPRWYTYDSSGNIAPYTNSIGQSYVDPSIVSFLHTNAILVTPSITNSINGKWDGGLISKIINNAASSSDSIANIVNIVVNNNYDGITIDYENLQSTDRTAFSDFIRNVSSALHAKGKIVAVEVHAKTSEPGTSGTPQAQDWLALGKSADEIRIMLYDYSWSTSAPGPVAPIAWIKNVLAFALTQIPSEKIIHGIPTYGYDWPVQAAASSCVWSDCMKRAVQYGAILNWDATSSTPWFQYSASNILHTVWFENASSTAAKLNANASYDIGGISLWRLGGEDPMISSVILSAYGGNIVQPVTADIKANQSDATSTIPYNTSAIISWTSTNATSCTIMPTGWSGTSNSGTSTGNLITTTIYIVECSGPSGIVRDSVTLVVAPPKDTQLPSVSIISPLRGAILSKNQRITVTASDNDRITKVMFYGDSKFLATVMITPYVAYWNTRQLVSGNHSITAVAYDPAGNSATSSVAVYKR